MENFIAHRSLVEQIVEGLERKILDGTFKPGERIIESAVCATLGVSRSPVREAFRILENEGFLVSRPRKGISVVSVTADEMRDIYQIRGSLESLAVSLAVEKRDPVVLDKLKRLHRRMIQVAEKSNTKAYFTLNLQFHETLIEACGNRRLIQLINTFVKQTMRYRFEVLSLPGWTARSVQCHGEILEFFESGDAEGAARARRETIMSHLVRLLQNYEEPKEGEK